MLYNSVRFKNSMILFNIVSGLPVIGPGISDFFLTPARFRQCIGKDSIQDASLKVLHWSGCPCVSHVYPPIRNASTYAKDVSRIRFGLVWSVELPDSFARRFSKRFHPHFLWCHLEKGFGLGKVRKAIFDIYVGRLISDIAKDPDRQNRCSFVCRQKPFDL